MLTLIGPCFDETLNGEKVRPYKAKIFFSQRYLEPLENKEVVEKTPNIDLFYFKIKDLFQLFFKKKGESNATVDESSIHPSFKYRNRIDLKQSLSITAAFEYYMRTMLPEISSPDTMGFYKDMEEYVNKYIETATGKKKKKAKSFRKSLMPQVSLAEKIKKSYTGYSNWQPLEPILSEWFGGDFDKLASAANLWRNELAHKKEDYKSYDVDKIIRAVRLVEHLNYCIVLRHAGYGDDQIKSILSKILKR